MKKMSTIDLRVVDLEKHELLFSGGTALCSWIGFGIGAIVIMIAFYNRFLKPSPQNLHQENYIKPILKKHLRYTSTFKEVGDKVAKHVTFNEQASKTYSVEGF